MTILEEIKIKLEIDVKEEIFDSQLISNLNAIIVYLKRNNIPMMFITNTTTKNDLTELDEVDRPIIIDYLYRSVLFEFDKELLSNATTVDFLKQRNDEILYILKSKYEKGTNDK